MNTIAKKAVLLIDSHHGIYIPQIFAEMYESSPNVNWDDISKDDIKILKDPDHEWYWEVWDSVLNNVTITDDNGVVHTLHNNEDLWAIPEGEYTEEEFEEWFI